MSFVVALDGPAAAGKGTISHAIRDEFGFSLLDTGLLYRLVGKKTCALDDPEDVAQIVKIAQNLDFSEISGDDLRGLEVAQAASRVAAISEVRAALIEFQRNFAKKPEGVVIDGRDIGTVICPDAEVKIFVTATPEVRAKRRFEELRALQPELEYEEVLASLIARDERDQARDDAPLKAAGDAYLLDTSDLSIERSIARAISLIKERIKPKG